MGLTTRLNRLLKKIFFFVHQGKKNTKITQKKNTKKNFFWKKHMFFLKKTHVFEKNTHFWKKTFFEKKFWKKKHKKNIFEKKKHVFGWKKHMCLKKKHIFEKKKIFKKSQKTHCRAKKTSVHEKTHFLTKKKHFNTCRNPYWHDSTNFFSTIIKNPLSPDPFLGFRNFHIAYPTENVAKPPTGRKKRNWSSRTIHLEVEKKISVGIFLDFFVLFLGSKIFFKMFFWA